MASSAQTRKLAGVEIPDTPAVRNAIAFAKSHADECLYHHVMRSCLLGFAIASKIPDFQDRDQEVHAISAILHDLGLDETGTLMSDDKRFEVDGAIAAREFLHREVPDWEETRVQLVWDSIALHTTPSIARYKQAEVAACGLGIAADVFGPGAVPGGALSMEVYEMVAKEFPRLKFNSSIGQRLCGLCKSKPATTYDNFVSDWGEKYVEGYSRDGRKAIDLFESCQLPDSF